MSVIIAFILAYIGYVWPVCLFLLLLLALLRPLSVKSWFKRMGLDLDETASEWDKIAKDLNLKKNEGKVKASDEGGKPLN